MRNHKIEEAKLYLKIDHDLENRLKTAVNTFEDTTAVALIPSNMASNL
ncbi:MAG: hypothetical protein AB8V23_05590 [Candidatus Midichloria sp.]